MGQPGYADREVTQPPDWHGLVVWDTVLNALATGLFLVAAVGELARPEAFAPVAAWAYPLALVVLLVDLGCLVLDLGDPLRFHHMLGVFRPSSPMSLGTWFLTGYSLPLTALAGWSVAGWLGWLPADVGWVKTALLVVGLPLGFGACGYKGVLFSATAQPGWRDARWLGAYHVLSALGVGAAVLLLIAAAGGHDRAAALLRPALAAVVVLTSVPLGLLVAELTPALNRVRRPPAGRRLRVALAVGAQAVALGLLAVGETVATLGAAAAVVATAYQMRSMVVRLPHAVHHG